MRIIPIPVYYPEATSILGEPAYRRVGPLIKGRVFSQAFDKPLANLALCVCQLLNVWKLCSGSACPDTSSRLGSPACTPRQTAVLHRRSVVQVCEVPDAPLDVLDVFRRPEDLAQHLDDILAAKPKACPRACPGLTCCDRPGVKEVARRPAPQPVQ